MKIERIVEGDGKLEKGDYDYCKRDFFYLRIFLNDNSAIDIYLPINQITIHKSADHLSVPYREDCSYGKSYKWGYKTNETQSI